MEVFLNAFYLADHILNRSHITTVSPRINNGQHPDWCLSLQKQNHSNTHVRRNWSCQPIPTRQGWAARMQKGNRELQYTHAQIPTQAQTPYTPVGAPPGPGLYKGPVPFTCTLRSLNSRHYWKSQNTDKLTVSMKTENNSPEETHNFESDEFIYYSPKCSQDHHLQLVDFCLWLPDSWRDLEDSAAHAHTHRSLISGSHASKQSI